MAAMTREPWSSAMALTDGSRVLAFSIAIFTSSYGTAN